MSATTQSTSTNSTSANSVQEKSAPASLEIFVQCLKKVPDPRSKRGQSHPFSTILAIVILGLLGNVSNVFAHTVKQHLARTRFRRRSFRI